MLVVFRGAQRVHALLSALQQDSAASGRRLFFRLRTGAAVEPRSGRAGARVPSPQPQAASRPLCPRRRERAEWSLADTALLNDAYRTLKDPLRRTEYLLKLQGAEIGEEHSGKGPQGSVARSRRSARRSLRAEHAARRDAHGPQDRAKTIRSCSTSLEAGASRKFDGLLDDVDQDLRAQWTGVGRGRRSAAREAAQKDHGGAARPPALPQQSGPRRDRNSGSLTE